MKVISARNLPATMTEQGLGQCLAAFGKIVDVKIVLPPSRKEDKVKKDKWKKANCSLNDGTQSAHGTQSAIGSQLVGVTSAPGALYTLHKNTGNRLEIAFSSREDKVKKDEWKKAKCSFKDGTQSSRVIGGLNKKLLAYMAMLIRRGIRSV